MRTLTIVGFMLLGIAIGFFYMSGELIEVSHIMSIIGGLGIGLFLGGIIGYQSKASAVKQEEAKRKMDELRNDKYELQQKVNLQKLNEENKETF